MKRVLLLALVIAALTLGGTWYLRGTYDHLVMDNGVFHVINVADVPQSIELVFPSQESRSAAIPAGGSVSFHVADTGEGAVLIRSGGEERASLGYVTSINPLTVIVVEQDGAVFSQYHRGHISTR